VEELCRSKIDVTQTGKILAHRELSGGGSGAVALHKSNVEFRGRNLDYGHSKGSTHHVRRDP
jgi:hypothetical protein